MTSFLTNYIENENPDLEDIILDSELLSELKFDQGKLKDYIIQNIHKIIDYLVIEPDVNASSKRNFSLPFKACEILCSYNSSIAKCIMQDETIFFQRFLDYLNKTDKTIILNSTLPGYGFKIIGKYIKSNTEEFVTLFSSNKGGKVILDCFKSTLYLDSSIDTLLLFLANQAECDEIKKKIIKILSEIYLSVLDDSTSLLQEDFSELKVRLQFDKLQNVCYMVMKLLKVMQMIEPQENIRKEFIDLFISKGTICLIVKYLNSAIDKIEKIYSQFEAKNSLNSVIHLITTMLVNLMDIKTFNDLKLNDVLTLFLFDEVMELDLISEHQKEPHDGFLNNLRLPEDYSKELFKLIIEATFPSAIKISSIVKNRENEEDSKLMILYKEMKIIKFSQLRLLFLDLIVLSLSSLEPNCFENGILSEHIQEALNCLSLFHLNSFLMNKVTKITEILVESSKWEKVFIELAEKNAFDKVIVRFNSTEHINVEEKRYTNKYFERQSNTIGLFLIVTLLKQKEENLAVSTKESLADGKEYYEAYKEVYSKSLTQDKQSQSDLPEQQAEDGPKICKFYLFILLNSKTGCRSKCIKESAGKSKGYQIKVKRFIEYISLYYKLQ